MRRLVKDVHLEMAAQRVCVNFRQEPFETVEPFGAKPHDAQ